MISVNSGNCYPLNEDKQALSCGNSGTYNCGNISKCNIIYCDIDVFIKSNSKQNNNGLTQVPFESVLVEAYKVT